MMTKSFENDSDTNHGLNSHRKPEDASFMREAIRLSQLAVEHGNEPFGAVLVKNGEIVFTNEIRFIQDMIRPFMEKPD